MKVKLLWLNGLFLAGLAASVPAQESESGPVQRQLREVYRELVEINTTDSAGSCTAAAQAMGARLRSAGLPAADVQVLVPPGGPKKGNLVARILGPVEAIAAAMWPGVPLVPTMSAGATDSRFPNNAGIPTYGISGMFNEPETSGVHGLNERLPVRSLYEGQEFLYRLVRALAGGR